MFDWFHFFMFYDQLQMNGNILADLFWHEFDRCFGISSLIPGNLAAAQWLFHLNVTLSPFCFFLQTHFFPQCLPTRIAVHNDLQWWNTVPSRSYSFWPVSHVRLGSFRFKFLLDFVIGCRLETRCRQWGFNECSSLRRRCWQRLLAKCERA